MLLGNRSVFQKNAMTYRNGTSTAGAYSANVINNLTQTGRNRNIYVNDMLQTFNRVDAVPIGYIAPYGWVMPQKDGGMASLKQSFAFGLLTPILVGAKNGTSNIAASIAITNADATLVAQAIANIAASIAITNAQLAAVLNAIANTLAASGSMNTPTIGALAGIFSNTSASIVLTSGSMNNSIGFMTSDITPFTELSPQSLAAAVLDALLADHTDPGSVGEALNNVGASGNPWASLLADNNTAGTFGAKIQKLLTTSKFLGLK